MVAGSRPQVVSGGASRRLCGTATARHAYSAAPTKAAAPAHARHAHAATCHDEGSFRPTPKSGSFWLGWRY